MVTAYERRPITVDEFLRMAELEIIADDERLELLDGQIVRMSPIGPRHGRAVDWLARAFILQFSGRAYVRIQNPIVLSDISMPQPDILLLVDDPVRYEREHPRVADAFLAVEVGDSSRIADRTVKEPLYARAGIAEAWFVDIVEREIRVVRRPRNGAFTTVLSFGRGDELACAAFPDDRFQVDDLLGPRAAD